MTRRKPTPPEAALVAIDVAKRRNEVYRSCSRGYRRRMTILNTRADHDKLIASLQAMQKPVVVGLEPTGKLPPCFGASFDCRRFQCPPHLQHGTGAHPRGLAQRVG